MGIDDKSECEILGQLKSGTMLIKRKSRGKKYLRHFFLHEYENYISYETSRRMCFRPRAYYIKDIDEIRPGFRSQTFDILLKKGHIKPADEELVFTIFYNNHRSEVHLMARDKHTRDLWVNGIGCLIDRHAKKTQRHLIKEDKWILNYFYEADTDKSNTLSKRECRKLLINSLHVKIPDQTFEQLFKDADTSGEGLLDPEEFIGFFHLITQRKDLYEIMRKHTKNGHAKSMETIYMDTDELLTFLQTIQNQTNFIDTTTVDKSKKIVSEPISTRVQVQRLIDEFELNSDLREQGLLSLDGFRNMLLSNDFDIVNPSLSSHIYQDMTRPLCDYYINTSHNTYLFNSQLSGESNPEAYNRVLLTGGRAVELDCYDGNDGRPIVTHGHTLVKPCSFESIIRYMEPNLFKKSPYPVILNIENHCSIPQQKEMTRILKEILGDRLLTKPLANKDLKVLPSPEDLKYKVLVRSRKVATGTKLHIPIQLEDDDDSIFDPLSKKIDGDLAELFVYLQNVPYREYDYAKINYSALQSSSLVENRFQKISRNDPSSLILQTTWRIIRTYPGGFRQDSSNADPIDAWNYGVQMAALNFQNSDDIMPLCYGKFLDNGGCGYVLKPKYIIEAQKTKYNPLNSSNKLDQPKILTLKIVSAQFLTKSNTKTWDIPDPYVTVSIQGLPCDVKTIKTKVIENNGFDPQWNETFSFRIKYPQMSLVYFAVYDYEAFKRDEKLAYFCLPLDMMQRGYRHIHLRTNNHDPTHSTLFVHVNIEDDVDICV